jgi:hypothetical protein
MQQHVRSQHANNAKPASADEDEDVVIPMEVTNSVSQKRRKDEANSDEETEKKGRKDKKKKRDKEEKKEKRKAKEERHKRARKKQKMEVSETEEEEEEMAVVKIEPTQQPHIKAEDSLTIASSVHVLHYQQHQARVEALHEIRVEVERSLEAVIHATAALMVQEEVAAAELLTCVS